MTCPRQELISVSDKPYCHIVSRCVRRSFLSGLDDQTGESCEHRRQWIKERNKAVTRAGRPMGGRRGTEPLDQPAQETDSGAALPGLRIPDQGCRF